MTNFSMNMICKVNWGGSTGKSIMSPRGVKTYTRSERRQSSYPQTNSPASSTSFANPSASETTLPASQTHHHAPHLLYISSGRQYHTQHFDPFPLYGFELLRFYHRRKRLQCVRIDKNYPLERQYNHRIGPVSVANVYVLPQCTITTRNVWHNNSHATHIVYLLKWHAFPNHFTIYRIDVLWTTRYISLYSTFVHQGVLIFL